MFGNRKAFGLWVLRDDGGGGDGGDGDGGSGDDDSGDDEGGSAETGESEVGDAPGTNEAAAAAFGGSDLGADEDGGTGGDSSERGVAPSFSDTQIAALRAQGRYITYTDRDIASVAVHWTIDNAYSHEELPDG